MNNQTQEALKMAIEALQNNQTYDWKGNPLTALDEANEKVINACKEALASYSEALDTKQVCENAAPAQEPVAWMGFNANGNAEFIRFNQLNVFTTKQTIVKQQEIPLYTHPAQPLSKCHCGNSEFNTQTVEHTKNKCFMKNNIGSKT